eukprot:3453918-Amphidinium_carterae.1
MEAEGAQALARGMASNVSNVFFLIGGLTLALSLTQKDRKDNTNQCAHFVWIIPCLRTLHVVNSQVLPK